MRSARDVNLVCIVGGIVLFLLLAACTGLAGGDGGPPVTRSPSDTSAIPEACELLDWFYSFSAGESNRVLSGQEIGSLDAPQGYYDYVTGLYRRIGQRPAASKES